MTFHTQERMDNHLRDHIHESNSVIIIPLILLAIPSMLLGALLVKPMLYNAQVLFLENSVYVLPQYNVMNDLALKYHGIFYSIAESFLHWPVWFSLAGIVTAWLCYVRFPKWPALLQQRYFILYWILMNKYGFDSFYNWAFVRGVRRLSNFCFNVADVER